jgi:hypothetical protein
MKSEFWTLVREVRVATSGSGVVSRQSYALNETQHVPNVSNTSTISDV